MTLSWTTASAGTWMMGTMIGPVGVMTSPTRTTIVKANERNVSARPFVLKDASAYWRAAKKKGKEDSKAKSKPAAPPPPTTAPSISAYRPKVSVEQEDDFMSSILGSMDQLPPTETKNRKRKPPVRYAVDDSSPIQAGRSPYRRPFAGTSSDGPVDDFLDLAAPSSPDGVLSPRKKVRTGSTSSMDPELEKMSRLDVHSADESDPAMDMSFDDVDMAAFMDLDDADLGPSVELKVEEEEKKPLRDINGPRPPEDVKRPSEVPSWLSIYDSLTVKSEDTLGPVGAASSTLKPSDISALEPDGSLRFFWLDYLEHEGKLYFVGKLKDKVTGTWVSCCVTVEGLQRNLFVLAREKRVEPNEDGELCETDIIPENGDVYADFDMVRAKFGIKRWKAKFVKRKYAFGERDVPKEERQWLKVVYGFDGGGSYLVFFLSSSLTS
jgi:DNA polymerase alpha subunit A